MVIIYCVITYLGGWVRIAMFLDLWLYPCFLLLSDCSLPYVGILYSTLVSKYTELSYDLYFHYYTYIQLVRRATNTYAMQWIYYVWFSLSS